MNPGGELEKRKAFRPISIASSVDTHGIIANIDGIYVFGNKADPGGWATNVKYQQLVHPSLHQTNTSTASFTNILIDSILFACVFGSKVFVVAKFANGNIFGYYDGVVITDFFYGRKVDAVQQNTGLLRDLLVAIIASGVYSGTQPVITPTTIEVLGAANSHYLVDIVKSSAAGTLTETRVNDGIPGTVATVAVGSFQIQAGSEVAGNQITQIAVGATNLLLAAVAFNDSVERTASDVVLAIIANSGTSGYTAVASGNTVIISAVATGTAANDKDVVVTAAGNVCIGQCSFGFVGTGFTLDYIRADGINVMTAALIFPLPAETLTAFCIRVAANINANSAVSGYLAYPTSNTIFLSKLVTKASDPAIAVSISVTDTGGTGAVFVGPQPDFLVTLNVSSVVARRGFGNNYSSIGTRVYAQPIGGVPPYTYSWRFTDDLANYNASVYQPQYQAPYFNFVVGQDQKPFVPVHALCDVTDSMGTVRSSEPLTINLA